MVWLLLFAAVLVGGLITAGVGLRGRRVDDHCLCRHCGFDLTGTPAAVTCNECGRDLTRPKAIRIGHRERRRPLLAGGLTLALIGTAGVGVIGYGLVATIEWIRFSPEWMLRRDLTSSNRQTSGAASLELFRRFDEGELSAESVAELIEDALDRQADFTRIWNVQTWGGFVEQARHAGQVNDEQWRRFATNALRPKFEIRPRARVGDPLPVNVRVGTWRGGPSAEFHAILDIDSIVVAEAKLLDGAWAALQQSSSSSSSGVPNLLKEGRMPDVASGQQEVRLRGLMRIAEGEHKPEMGWRNLSGPMLATIELDERMSVTAAPSDAAANLMVYDPSLEGQMKGSVHASRAWIERTSPWESGLSLRFVMRVAPSPVPRQWRLSARFGNPDWPDLSNAEIQVMPMRSDGVTWWEMYEVKLPLLAGDDLVGDGATSPTHVDLTLVPDVEAAMRRTDGALIWGGEIHIPGVPVSRAHARTGHTPATYGAAGVFEEDPG